MFLEQRLDFIASLPPLPNILIRSFMNEGGTAPVHDVNNPTATVMPGTIDAYFPGVPQNVIDDVDLCKLVMQNAATKQFPEDDRLFEWYKCYVDGLSNLGWIIQNKHMQETTIRHVGLTMDMVALEVARGLIGKDAALLANLAKQSVDAVQGRPQSIALFDTNNKLGKQAKFDIAPVWLDAAGSPNMILNCISLDARESTRGILFWKSTKQSTTIKTGAVRTYLNQRVFSRISDTLYTKYTAQAEKYIDQLPDLDF
jgi:hypothetical protein